MLGVVKRPLLGLCALAAGLWLVGCQPQGETEATSSGTATAGQDPQARLRELSGGEPTFVLFVKDTCGSNPRAIPLFNKLSAAHQGKAKFVGVINVDEAGLKDWKAEFPNDIEFVNDPDKKLINFYSVTTSQTTLLLDAEGKEAKRFDGYGKDAITALNAEMGAAGKHVAQVDLSEAPSSPAYG